MADEFIRWRWGCRQVEVADGSAISDIQPGDVEPVVHYPALLLPGIYPCASRALDANSRRLTRVYRHARAATYTHASAYTHISAYTHTYAYAHASAHLHTYTDFYSSADHARAIDLAVS